MGSVIDIDKGWGNLVEELKKINRNEIFVGIQAGETSEDGQNLAYIGSIHEFGKKINVTPKMRAYLHSQGLHLNRKTQQIKIPQRSFLRATVAERQDEITAKGNTLINQVVVGNIDGDTALKRMGAFVQGLVQKRMSEGIAPALHPFTIKRKTVRGLKGTTPLIGGNSSLRRAIRYVIKPK